jgi:predicted nuclease of predicted toxin-antitoxin system
MSAFLVKLDEDLPTLAAEFLASRGYDVRTIAGQNWCGTKDSRLWPMIQREGAFFVTADKGFGDIHRYPPGSHRGVLLLRPDHESAPQFVRLLEVVVSTHSLDQLAGALTVASPGGVRIRRPPAID